MRGKKRNQKWAEVPKPDIEGNVPKVAFEISKKLKDGPKSNDLSLQIVFRSPYFTDRFNYSVVAKNGVVEISNKKRLCELKLMFADTSYLVVPDGCRKCYNHICYNNELLSELADYLKDTYNIRAIIHQHGFKQKTERRETTYDFLQRKLHEGREKGYLT